MAPNSNSECLNGGGRGICATTAATSNNAGTTGAFVPSLSGKLNQSGGVAEGLVEIGTRLGMGLGFKFVGEKEKVNTNPTSMFTLNAASGDAGVEDDSVQRMRNKGFEGVEELKPDPNKANLYLLPESLSPIYKTMPFLTQLSIGISSAVISARWHLQSVVRAGVAGKSVRGEIVKFSLRFFTVSLLSTLVTQELFFSSSRIDTPTLVGKKWLPSTLSNYAPLTTQIPPILLHTKSNTNTNPIAMDTIGVHYLQYTNTPSSSPKTQNIEFDAIHFNHGFGANSLSWLPVIPPLTDRLNARISLAHDSPGLGFTDRPKTFGKKNSLAPYSSAGAAALGNKLVLDEVKVANDDHDTNNDTDHDTTVENDKDDKIIKKIALFGHSLGCATTLRMALSLPGDYHKVVVLVAPALLGSTPPQSLSSSRLNNKNTIMTTMNTIKAKVTIFFSAILKRCNDVAPISIEKMSSWFRFFIVVVRTVFVDSTSAYILKRAVGMSNFWSDILRIVWGDPNLLTKSDILCFQWASIGLGWERGLLAFARSRLFMICNYDGGELKLLDDVIHLPNTSVVVVHGTKDRIIPISSSRHIAKRYTDSVTYIELKGMGHDPFEEGKVGTKDFVDKVVHVIKK